MSNRCFTHIILCSILLFGGRKVSGQFSPGDLSRAHSGLDGSVHCTKCHEVGAEITGRKCLDCHTEIGRLIAARHGFHAAHSSQRCTSCHKEHLGRNVRTVMIDRASFDHAKTGLNLTGKHEGLACEQCHHIWNIKDDQVLALAKKTGRKTMLGLESSCRSCHSDPHKGSVGAKCESCHTVDAWNPAPRFDHAATEFPLQGKHQSVACAKCHAPLDGTTANTPDRIFGFGERSFSDCSSCHRSPHTRGMAEKACGSCHTPDGWFVVQAAGFNHDHTGFALRGKHALLQCRQCHAEDRRSTTTDRHEKRTHCIDCHADYHNDEFTVTYRNDCSICHTAVAFSPSIFTLAMHKETRFPLSGAHAATTCAQCHPEDNRGHKTFHLRSIACVSCHKDRHDGQFATLMGEAGCASCHSTSSWKVIQFDHSSTKFALSGKHETTPCSGCHKRAGDGTQSMVHYAGLSPFCESCHTDVHAGQFADRGVTHCSPCHTPTGWTHTTFNHNTSSVFSLTGAHARVPCTSCHRREEIAGQWTVRFKPLSAKCENCHTGGAPTDG